MHTIEDARTLADEAEALQAKGDYAAAIAAYRRIAESEYPDECNWGRLGDALVSLGEFAQAVDAFTQAIERNPDIPELQANIARPFYVLGDARAAVRHLEQAIPHFHDRLVLQNLAIMAPGVPGYSLGQILAIRRAYGLALAHTEKHPAACLEEAMHSLDAIVDTPRPARQRESERNANEPLRVAYLSAHFAQPAYMGPVWALINNHDRPRHKIYLLSDAAITGVFPDYRTHPEDTVLDVSGASDDDVDAFLTAERIDILMDLSGYSYTPRLSLFARRLRPAVATWFNMYSTSGLPGIDYIIGDEHVVFPEEERWYSEKVLRLPQSYLTFQPWEGRAPVAPAPCAKGAPFTFGSLVSMYKITEPVVEAWCEMLKGTPDSRLLLANGDLKSQENKAWLLERFTSRGITAGRILFRDPAPHDAFLRYYDEIDLALDSFPYSGGTTSMEALWQGVPVLTQAGEGWAARTTGTLLAGTHLVEFCCRNIAHYVEKGIGFSNASDTPQRLATWRATMREDLRASSTLDGAGLARAMEALYARM